MAKHCEICGKTPVVGRQVDAASVDLRGIPGRTIEEIRLRRNAQLKEQTYTALQQRFDQSRLAAEATVPDVRVLDPAIVPQRPIKNTKPRLLLMGLLAGLGLGLVAAWIGEAERRVALGDPDLVRAPLATPDA